MGARLSSDSWFGSVKSVVSLAKQGYMTVLQVKIGLVPIQKSSLKKLLKVFQVTNGLNLNPSMKAYHT
jgi:hypothetical protein